MLDLEAMLEESDNRVPLICLLSTGSDPSPQIESIAKSRMQELHQLSMGQGQEEAARKYMTLSISKGHWLLLQNCHLSLSFCDEIMQTIIDTEEVGEQKWYHNSWLFLILSC